MNIFSLFTLAGGLAFFLYGMHQMSNGLEKLAGGKLESVLQHMMSNKIKAVLLGMGITAVIQSSSATTVMVIGLVNSKIMNLAQAISVILGANVGTTITAWILSLTGINSDNFIIQLFKPSSFAPVIALLGIIMILRDKSLKSRSIGQIMVAFAILMAGITTMGDALAPLSGSENFMKVMETMKNPAIAFIIGITLTCIVQSSSASVGILQAIALNNPIGYSVVIPMVVGQNVGASVAPLLASIGQGTNGKRAAYSYLFANLIGSVVILTIYAIARHIFDMSFMGSAADVAGIAIVHTCFNIFIVVLLYPFVNKLEALMIKLFKEDEKDNENTEFPLLDPIFINTPAFALAKAKGTTDEMMMHAEEAFNTAVSLIGEYSAEGCKKLKRIEARVDRYEDSIGRYLEQVSKKNMNSAESHELSVNLQAIGDIERISDHSQNIGESVATLAAKGIIPCEETRKDIDKLSSAVMEIIGHTRKAFYLWDPEKVAAIEPLEQVIDELSVAIKKRSIDSIMAGRCNIEEGFCVDAIVTDLERISDHCFNLAMFITRKDAHEYINILKREQSNEFKDYYYEYRKKYRLD